METISLDDLDHVTGGAFNFGAIGQGALQGALGGASQGLSGGIGGALKGGLMGAAQGALGQIGGGGAQPQAQDA